MADDDTKPEEVLPHTDENPAPEHVPDPVQPEARPQDDTRDLLNRTVARVDELATQVGSLLQTGADTEHDTVPVKKPWTHRRLF